MRQIIVTVFILLYAINVFADNKTDLYIDKYKYSSFPASNKINGLFTEFLWGYINSYGGLWAQELTDRGFDDVYDYSTTLKYWQTRTNSHKLSSNYCILNPGGYNENGKFSVKLLGDTNHYEYGIYQKVFINDTVGLDFYVYTRSDKHGETWNLVVMDSLCKNVLYKSEKSAC